MGGGGGQFGRLEKKLNTLWAGLYFSTWLSLGVPGAEVVWVLMVVLVVVAAMQTVLLPARLLSPQLINHIFISIKYKIQDLEVISSPPLILMILKLKECHYIQIMR
jgi:hypothetical protein